MRHLYPREKHQLVFGGVVAAVGVVALLLFLVLYLPSRAEYLAAGDSIERLEAESEARRTALDRLEAATAGMDEARQEWSTFLGARLITRDEGYAVLIPDTERLAQFAGVSRDSVTYNIIEETQFGLYAVLINMPVRSSYASLTQFIEELEDADTFFILDAIQLRQPEVDRQGVLDLSLNLTTFFSE